jgi:lipid II:glycine glycyltransferase (peptidoglycan interpeptide bridge formation enzyme)
MKIIRNEQINRQKWLALVQNCKVSTPFQTPTYYDFFNSLTGFSADVFAVEKNSEYLCLVVVTIQSEKGIKASFSKRGIIYGGFLLTENNGQALEALLKNIIKHYSRKLIYLETRNFNDYSAHKTVFENQKWQYNPWLNYHLSVVDDVSVKKNMSSSRLRQIKKATNSGVIWKEANTIEDVEIFYKILLNLYTEKVKKPLLPWAFFKTYFEKNIGKYLLVYYEEIVIGGIMCPILDGKAIYEFYVCGLDQEYKEQYPSVMATWAAIEYALQNNIPLFDFMGAGAPDEGYGVREFKERFGGEQVEQGRFIKIINPLLYRIGKLGLNIMAKIKK